MKHRQWVVAAALSGFGCRPSAAPAPSTQVEQALPREPSARTERVAVHNAFDEILPDVASPFAAAAPIQHGQGYVRRTYVSGAEHVEITIARFGKDPGAFAQWVAGSANYPQAQLSLPPSQANGFFSCASDLPDAACDLHIQLRAGFHVEVMGNGRVPRRDLMDLMTRIQLGHLSESTLAAL